jgi:hypothetical protein
MIKPFDELGKSWGEVLGSTILLVLMAPLLLIILVFLWLFIIFPSMIWSWLRREPKLQVPEVAGEYGDETDIDEYVDCYIKRVKFLVPDIDIRTERPSGIMEGFSFHTTRAKEFSVELYYNNNLAGFTVKKIKSGSWHTDEGGSIDIYFWIIIGILRYGAFENTSSLGFKRYWVKVDEFNAWVKVFPEKNALIDTFFSLYRKPPEKVLQDYEAQQKV